MAAGFSATGVPGASLIPWPAILTAQARILGDAVSRTRRGFYKASFLARSALYPVVVAQQLFVRQVSPLNDHVGEPQTCRLLDLGSLLSHHNGTTPRAWNCP